MTEPVGGDPASSADLRVAQAWIDALTSGACDEAAFLQALPAFTRDTPDAGWGLLSLIDQNYRRGKIPSESFQRLKSYLESRLLRPGFDPAVSVPLPLNAQSLPAAESTVPILVPVMTLAAAMQEKSVPIALPEPLAPLAPQRSRRRVAVGDLLRGRYLIKGMLGRGGMGMVLEAVDQYRLNLPNAGQHVAIKVLHAAVSERPELHDELRREFQLLQSLSHPNIVRVHEYDRDGDIAFFTMELLRGRTLGHAGSDADREGPGRAHTLSIIRDVGEALAFAHARGVVHGDLNPGNIFITDDWEIRVLDFGSSHRLRAESCSGPIDVPAKAHWPIATPRYASCQVLEGDAADERDDVYAFACIVYLLLTGTHPFGERTALEARTLSLTPPRPDGIAGQQWDALLAGLAFDRAARPSDVQAWLAPFIARDEAASLPAPRHRYRVPALIMAGLVALVVGWWALTKSDRVTVADSAPEQVVHEASAGSAPLPTPSSDAGASEPREPESAVSRSQGSDAQVAADHPVIETSPESALPETTAQLPPAPVAAAAAAAAPAAPAVKNLPGRSRIDLTASTLDLPPGGPTAQVVVRRTGNVQADARFSWWTESGTAKPGQDFAPVAPHEELFQRFKTSMSLYIPIVADSTRREPRSFYVVIGDPVDGATLGERTLMMVTVPAQP